MILTNTAADISLGQAGLYAVLGYGVVFLGLILLMIVVVVFGKAFTSAENRKHAAEVSTQPEQTPAAPPEAAPGSAGQLKLHNVDPKTAAMLMAITADKMEKPINELRFLSIKEVSK